jgi:hypothetical protein
VCTDALKVTAWEQLRQSDLKPFARFLTREAIVHAASKTGIALGRGPLNAANLVWLAIASALHTGKNFASVLGLVLKLLRDAPDWPQSDLAKTQRKGQRQAGTQKRKKHDPRGQDPTSVSEEAFVQARRKLPWAFWVNLLLWLSDRFEHEHGDKTRWKQFRLLAIDGTCINLGAWKPLVKEFGTASNGKGPRRRRTQARMVMVQMPLVRIPWRYELTSIHEAEKTVAGRLLTGLRVNDLLLMDRGFWSYGLFWQIHNQQAFFAIRLVASVRLQTVKKLGYKDRLVRFQPRDPKKKWRHLPPSLELRLIDYQVKGFRPSALVTSVTDPRVITRQEWIQMATVEAGRVLKQPGLYHRRWEIETTFRELKVTQGMQGGLRSRTPEGIRYEVAGHVLLYLLIRWLIVEAAAKAGVEDPLRLSFAEARQELLDMNPQLVLYSEAHVTRVLLPRLLERMASHRVPLRPGRHYPRPNDKKPKNRGHGNYQKPSKLSRKQT